MFDIVYRKRVQRDLPGWVAKGWVRPESAELLLRSIPGGDLRDRLPAIVAVLGALLLAMGAMTFVAANWAGLSRGFRLGLLLGALWFAYGGAIWLKARGWAVLYEAAVVLACGIFGANIMLIAQMYHIDSHYPDGIMIWGLGTMFAAGLSRSIVTIVAGFSLLALWTVIETNEFTWPVHWPFLIAWFASAWLVWYERWSLGVNAAALALFAWIVVSTVALHDYFDWTDFAPVSGILALVGIIGVALAARFEAKLERRDGVVWRVFTAEALGVLFVLLFVLQLTVDDNPSYAAASVAGNWFTANLQLLVPFAAALATIGALGLSVAQDGLTARDAAVLLVVTAVVLACALLAVSGIIAIALLAAAYFGLAVWTIGFGQRRHQRSAINLAFAAFGLEALYVYFRTIGTLLDTAMFFIGGGIALVVLAVVLERLRRRLVDGQPRIAAKEQPA